MKELNIISNKCFHAKLVPPSLSPGSASVEPSYFQLYASVRQTVPVRSQNPRTNRRKNLGGACAQEFIILKQICTENKHFLNIFWVTWCEKKKPRMLCWEFSAMIWGVKSKCNLCLHKVLISETGVWCFIIGIFKIWSSLFLWLKFASAYIIITLSWNVQNTESSQLYVPIHHLINT